VVIYRTVGTDSATLATNRAIVDSTLADGTPVPDGPPGFRAVAEARAAQLGAGLQIAKAPTSQRTACDRASGCSLSWQVLVVNADRVDLTDATVTDFLPAGLTYHDSRTPAGWSNPTVGAAGSGPSSTTPITWTHSGPFASGQIANFRLTASVPVGTGERSYLNQATAGADQTPTVEDQALATVFSTVSVGDLVWHDVDRDGRQDHGEPGMPGVTVQLHDESGTLVAATATDATGHYQFSNLDPGRYRLRFLVPHGWRVSPAHVGGARSDSDPAADGWSPVFALVSGVDDLTWDAGLYQARAGTSGHHPGGPGDGTGAGHSPHGRGRGSDGSGGGSRLATTGSNLVTLLVIGFGLVGFGGILSWRRLRRPRPSRRQAGV
jgi:hypothetical protein